MRSRYGRKPIETADCGCGLYETDNCIQFDGKTYCPECFMEMIRELTYDLDHWETLADLVQADYWEVE